jgi:hypothetical protein
VPITRRSTIADVAAVVATALRVAGFDAVLTGGACAAIYSAGASVSHDLDFIIRAGGGRSAVDDALAAVGFARRHDRYVHPKTPFFVEFPRGPLSIGDDTNIRPAKLKIGRLTIAALSPTDSCRDRLAAFYHWSDRQSLRSAVEIAVRTRVNMAAIRRWSEREGASDKFEEFRDEVARRRQERGTA